MAEYHFRRSLLINQRSSVLRCYVGVALHKIGRTSDALDQLQVPTLVDCALLVGLGAFSHHKGCGLSCLAEILGFENMHYQYQGARVVLFLHNDL